MTDETRWPPTLGERLEAQGRRLTARLLPYLPWAGPLEVVVDRATALAAPFDGRFERVESLPDRAELRTSDAGGDGARRVSAVRGGGPPAPMTANGRRPGPVRGRAEGPADGRSLPADIRSRLRGVAGRGVDILRVHDDDAADELARAHRADAVTVGHDVYFRQGRFTPRDDPGFALLAHEARHVLGLLRPGAAWHRATGGGVRDEEEDALAYERAPVTRDIAPVPRGVARRSTPVAAGRASAVPGSATPASLAARPMKAAEDRDTSWRAPAPPDLEALRRGLLNDLMRQLRAEFERGG